MTNQRIGFCCKYLLDTAEKKNKQIQDAERMLNTSTTTVAWLNRQTRGAAEDKLWSIVKHNLASVQRVLQIVATWTPALRMMRIGSDICPVYTESSWSYFWQQEDVRRFCETEFAKIGAFARANDIRLSFHPGQYCVLSSENSDIVQRSIDEFEYHTDMARWMGYGSSWHDHGFKINVHIAGRRGPQGIIDALGRLSPESRNLITIENDENTWGIDASIELANHVALVLDVHHHLLHSGGEYIQPDDVRCKKIWDSWQGTRPVIHYSISREDVLAGHDAKILPDIKQILESKKSNKTKLRAHSDDTWNIATNRWVLGFLPHTDIQVESKWKNISSRRLWQQIYDEQINIQTPGEDYELRTDSATDCYSGNPRTKN